MTQLNLIPKLNLNHILYLLLFYTAGKTIQYIVLKIQLFIQQKKHR